MPQRYTIFCLFENLLLTIDVLFSSARFGESLYQQKKASITESLFLYSYFLNYATGSVPPIRITTNKAKIAYNSGNTAITIVAPNTLWPAPTPAIPLAQT